MELRKIWAGVALVLTLAYLALPWIVPQVRVHAQVANACDETISISVSAAATQTIASAVPGTTVYVCAYDLSADTIATTGQFASSGTNLTGAMRFCDECNHAVANGSPIFQGTPGGSLTLTAATGAITGWVRMGQN